MESRECPLLDMSGGWVDSDIEICLKYLPADATEANLKQEFASCGAITGEPSLMRTPQGLCKGMGWINFATAEGDSTPCSYLRRNPSRLS